MEQSLSAGAEKNLVKRYPLAVFFVLAYGLFLLSLLAIGGIVSVGSVSPEGMGVLIAVGSWTPTVAALIVVWVNGGPTGMQHLLAGWLRWRVHLGWYLFGLLPLVITLAVAAGSLLLGNPAPGGGTGITGATLLSMLLFNGIQGATGEEPGWRGFALPRLQTRYSRLVSAIILGLLIAGWHAVLHIFAPSGAPEWQFWLVIVCYSVIIAWGYHHTGGSLLIVSLFHFSSNFAPELVTTRLGLISTEHLFWGYVVVNLLLAIGVTLLDGKQAWQKPAAGGR